MCEPARLYKINFDRLLKSERDRLVSLGYGPDKKEYFTTQENVNKIKEINKKIISSFKNPHEFKQEQLTSDAKQRLETLNRITEA